MEDNNNKSHEIDVLALAMKVLKEWKTLLCFIVIFAILGIIVAIGTPKKYTTTVILAPEMSSGMTNSTSNISEMASFFGINLQKGTQMDAIYPQIYPDIFSSTDFLQSLFNVKVRLKNDDTERTYVEHIKKDTKIPFWNYPMLWVSELMSKEEPEKSQTTKPNGKKKNDPFRMSKTDYSMCKVMGKSMTCLVDKKTYEITITVTDQDPLVAAIMADTLQRRLQAYITEYRTKKARIDYDYYTKLTREAEAKYNGKKGQYAGYSDSHRNSVLESVNTESQSLKSNMSKAYDVYSSMLKMRERAMAKIQENTPAFTIIQSAKAPIQPSNRSKSATVMIFIFLGCIFNAGWVLIGKNLFKMIKSHNINA